MEKESSPLEIAAKPVKPVVNTIKKELSEEFAGAVINKVADIISTSGHGRWGREKAKNIASVLKKYPKIPNVR